MANSNSSTGSGVVRYFGILVVLTGISWAAVMLFVWRLATERKRVEAASVIRDSLVASNVYAATLSFLRTQYEKETKHHDEEDHEFRYPDIEYIENCSFWQDVRGVDFVRFGGAVYRVGDFCEHGLIVGITTRRVFCQKKEGFVILVPVAKDIAETDAARSDSSPEAERTAAAGQYL